MTSGKGASSKTMIFFRHNEIEFRGISVKACSLLLFDLKTTFCQGVTNTFSSVTVDFTLTLPVKTETSCVALSG